MTADPGSLLAHGAAALVGLSLGLLGGGGSILTVPLLVYGLGVAPKPAIAMSLPVVGAASLASAALHWRFGRVRVRAALAFAAVAMLGAFAGARVGARMSGALQLALLAIVMLVAAAAMLRAPGARGGAAPATSPTPPPAPTTAAARAARLAPIALGVGVLTGMVGIGGGFLVVPALVLLLGVPMREAVGTSLLVIALNAAAALVGYLGRVSLDWDFLAGFGAATVAGALAGTLLVARVPQAALKRAFAVLLLAIGALVLHQNRHVLLGRTPPAVAQDAR